MLEQFPIHRKIADRVVNLFQQDKRVMGLYLSGSFAFGQPDEWSDIDFNILVPENLRGDLIEEHKVLRSQVGEILTEFTALHVGDPFQIVTIYRDRYPVHVDYSYQVENDLAPANRFSKVAILFDRTSILQSWKVKCAAVEESYSPTQSQLQYFEDRFWAWTIYTDSKIRRGELWEARDAIEFIRNNVLVRLACHKYCVRFEGNRRVERKFPHETVRRLESTLQTGHSAKHYRDALLAMMDCYVELMSTVLRESGIRIHDRNRIYFEEVVKQEDFNRPLT